MVANAVQSRHVALINNSQWFSLASSSMTGKEETLHDLRNHVENDISKTSAAAIQKHDYAAAEIILAAFAIYSEKLTGPEKDELMSLVCHLGTTIDEVCMQ